TLNNISALCKYDPAEADRAITLFARYMHSYMYVINEKENISIEKELELVKVTLEIEQLRFPNTFNYSIDIAYSDFKIPPLSLQPLVENALYHGLRPLKEGGQLKISIAKIQNSIEITITDNGVGFEVSSLDTKDSIGLTNLKKRLHIMANGSVNIQSTKGLGTSIIITLPLEI
ncbi:MAG: histidine kinase, partial [Eubacteriales bacterium]